MQAYKRYNNRLMVIEMLETPEGAEKAEITAGEENSNEATDNNDNA